MTGHAPRQGVSLFLSGDVMTGRGLDQVQRHPSDPTLHELYVRDARQYVALAEEAAGPIPRRVEPSRLWGDALAVLEHRRPHARIVNLETSVTTSPAHWRKGINYRMHPANIDCLTAAGIDCCTLANNHVLDWGHAGLAETEQTLRRAGIRIAGAGADLAAAQEPATLPVTDDARVLVFAYASTTSGVPTDWGATPERAGVHRLADLSQATLQRVAAYIRARQRPDDIVVVSVHWGGNWGFDIPAEEVAFARGLIDEAGVDVVHGHSSHHVKGIEIYRDRLILYGCGDLLNDYEGIGGPQPARDDLGLMYFPRLEASTGRLQALEMVPTRLSGFRLQHATGDDWRWLYDTLQREGARLGTGIEAQADGVLALLW